MIPKRLHRIWLGSDVPIVHERTWQQWRELFPDYELTTWTETELCDLGMPDYFYRAQTYAERADIARLRIINLCGGIYTDCDMEPLARFDYLWTSHDRLITFEERSRLICNGLFAAAPGALSFVADFVERNSRRNAADAAPNVRTGPFAFTAAIDYLSFIDPRGIRVYPPSFLDLDGTSRTAVIRTILQASPVWAKADPEPEAASRTSTFGNILFDLRLVPLRLRRYVRR